VDFADDLSRKSTALFMGSDGVR
jgi:hypothetical protein